MDHTRVQSQSGQVGIIVILIMVVLLTVGLSLATRTTQELFLTQQESDSTRVFNAAETGVESALAENFSAITGRKTGGSTVNSADVNYSINPLQSLDTIVLKGGVVQVNTAGATGGRRLNISWGKEDNCATLSSLLISIYSQDPATGAISTRYVPWKPCNETEGGEGFHHIPGAGTWHARREELVFNQTDIFIRIQVLRHDTQLLVEPVTGTALPIQSHAVRSTATDQQGAESAKITKIVEVNRSLPTAPSVMDYVVFSGAQITTP